MVQHATSAGQTIGVVMDRGRASVALKSDARYVISFSVAVWLFFLEFCFFSIPPKSNLNSVGLWGSWCVFISSFLFLSFSFDDLSYLSVLGW